MAALATSGYDRAGVALMTVRADDASAVPTPPPGRGPLEVALRLFADVREGEAVSALLLTLDVFLLLTAYYVLKVAREPLILLGGGAEVKSYAAVGQSILLIFVSFAYGWLAARVSRLRLIAWVTLFFASNLVVFWFFGIRGAALGVPFFLWVGVFNVTTVTQFWSFAADVYSEEQGKRLFPVLGIGSSVGAVAGAFVAKELVFLGPFVLMLVAAALLVLCLFLTAVVHRRESARAAGATKKEKDEPLDKGNGFSLVFKDRYLLLIAALVFVLNWITKTGDYVLDREIIVSANAAAGHGGITALAYIGEFKGRYFEWINIIGVVLQLFAVSRIIKYLGMRAALVIMPVVSLLGYGSILVVPLIGVMFAARVAESSLDYSLSTTTRNALWLVTSRDAKYKAKQVIDTFVVRGGDVMSAALVWGGTHLALSTRGFVLCNVILSAVWLLLASVLGKKEMDLERSGAGAEAAEKAPAV